MNTKRKDAVKEILCGCEEKNASQGVVQEAAQIPSLKIFKMTEQYLEQHGPALSRGVLETSGGPGSVLRTYFCA